MQDKLIEAFFDAPHRVLGRRLHPFTLRHAFILAAGDNAFFNGGTPTVGDLYQAVEICSRPPGFFPKGGTPSKWRRRWWEIRTSRCDRLAEAEKFRRYIEDYTASPSVWTSVDGGKGAKCHWVISTVAAVVANLHLQLEEAWNLSPGEASWYLVASYESNPWAKIDVMSEEEEEAIELMKHLPDDPVAVD